MPKKVSSRVTSPFFRREEVDELVKSRAVVDRAIAVGWLVPQLSKHRYTIFSREAVMALLARLQAGEFPEGKNQ